MANQVRGELRMTVDLPIRILRQINEIEVKLPKKPRILGSMLDTTAMDALKVHAPTAPKNPRPAAQALAMPRDLPLVQKVEQVLDQRARTQGGMEGDSTSDPARYVPTGSKRVTLLVTSSPRPYIVPFKDALYLTCATSMGLNAITAKRRFALTT